jgi:signal transduction histidine kinase
MVLAVATVLVFSLRSLSREKQRLFQEFAGAQEAAARELASELSGRLQDVEEDGRVLAALVKDARSGAAAKRPDKGQTMLASFRALANVVRYYRNLALFGADAGLLLSATDPTEDAPTVAAMLRISHDAVTAPGAARLIGPIDVPPGRRFYLYRFAVGADTVVIAIEGPRLLQALRSVPDGKVVVTDPSGVEWIGCAPTTLCAPRLLAERGAEERGWTAAAGTAWVDSAAAARFGLRREIAAVAWDATASQALGSWGVLLAVSAGPLRAREQTLTRQLLLTALGLLAAIGLVGALIVRQQRYAAALAERLRAAEKLQALELQLIRAEKLATTGVLAAGIAHEIGTPLGIIRARAEILQGELGRTSSARALDAIVTQIDRISSTIRQVLDFSRAQRVEVQAVEAAVAVRGSLELLDHRFRQQELAVHVDVAPELPAMAADPNQLQQVLINLLLNACDACARRGSIWISARPEADRIRWDIRDDGSGISPENMLAVFDPFFTTKKRGEGTGLGLSVAASIVRNHGGDVTIASAVGDGTTVTLLWPVAKQPDQTARQEAPHVEG